MYDSPTQPTVRLESPTKFTTGETTPNLRTLPTSATKRTIDRVVDRYIVLNISGKIY